MAPVTELEVEIISHSAGAEVVEGMPEWFRAQANDGGRDGWDLQARWEVEGDIICSPAALDDQAQTTCEIALGSGQDAVTVVVENTAGKEGSATVQLALSPNSPPSVTLEAPAGDGVFYADQPVRLEAILSDAEEPPSQLTASWSSSLDGGLAENLVPTSDGRVVAHAELSKGAHVLLVTATDSGAQTGADRVDIVVGPANSLPSCEIVAPTDEHVVEVGDAVTLEGVVSDPDVPSDWLQIIWTSDKDGELSAGGVADSAGTVQTVITDLSADAHTISLMVTDEVGATCIDSILVYVEEPPDVEILQPVEDGIYYTNHPVNFEGQVTDAAGDLDGLRAHWRSDVDGTLDIAPTLDEEGLNVGSAYLRAGDHVISLTVVDPDGVSSTVEVGINVHEDNHAPTCGITHPLSGAVGDVADPVLLTGAVDDVDVGPTGLTVQWFSDIDGDLGTTSALSTGEAILAAAGLSLGTHTLTMVVTDDAGETCTDAVLFIVGQSPEVTILRPVDGEVVDQGTLVWFEGLISDPEEVPGELTLSWESDLDGVIHTGSPDGADSTTFSSSELATGTHTVSLTATDSIGLSTTEAVTLVVNGVPSAPEVRVLPEGATTLDTLTVSFDSASTDPDGDVLTYAYTWLVDGVPESTAGVILPSETAKGQTWTVQVTASDGASEGPPGEASMTIRNSPPIISLVEIHPDPLRTDDVAEADVVVTDVDDDEIVLTYAWTVGGESAGDASTLDGAVAFDKGEEVGLTVSAFDLEDEAGAVEASALTVLNTAPTTPEVVIEPETPGGGLDDLWCAISMESTDVDDDPLDYSFSWTVDDVSWPDTPESGELSTTVHEGDTVPGSVTVEGEIWACHVHAQDGEDAGGSASADTVVVEAPPGCGDGVVDPGEEYDPAPGPFEDAPVDSETCRFDFSEIEQLYCQGICDYGGPFGCDDADADVLCKLITDNPDSVALSYTIISAMTLPGFSGIRCGLGVEVTVDRGLDMMIGFQDGSLVAGHGPGDVVAFPECTDP